MNIYQLMENLYASYAYLSPGGDDAATWPFTPIRELYEAYYAFCPPIEDWPEDAQWFTVDDYGDGEWHTTEPFPGDGVWETSLHFDESQHHKMYLFPDGIDWRLCKWPRPEVDA